MAESAAGDALFERTGKVSFVQVLPHALQHVLAAFAGIVTPAIIIASVCGFTPQEEAAVIQASLVLSALDIFLQQFPIKGVVGSGLPIVMGASFTFVPALKAVGLELGFEAVLGAQVIGGALVVLFGLLFRRVSFLFPAPGAWHRYLCHWSVAMPGGSCLHGGRGGRGRFWQCHQLVRRTRDVRRYLYGRQLRQGRA